MAKNVSIFDGTSWVSIVGPAGKDGVDGKDGSGVSIKGPAAQYPPDASPTVGDMWLVPDPIPAGMEADAPFDIAPGDGLVFDGVTEPGGWVNVGGIRGPKGSDGAPGADGTPGQDGAAGAPGADGAAGKDGVGLTYKGEYDAGAEYENNDVVTFGGETYIVSGLTKAALIGPGDLKLIAKKGSDGAAGADGATGADGADGRSVNVTKGPTQPATAAIGDFWIETE
jgi:hypothetical protein